MRPLEVKLAIWSSFVFFIYFFFFLFSLNRSAHLREKKKKRSGHQSPLNKVFGLPSFGLEKRPVKKQELLYVINIFWTLKGCFLPLDISKGSPRRLSQEFVAALRPKSILQGCQPQTALLQQRWNDGNWNSFIHKFPLP